MENRLLNDNELEQAQGGTTAYGVIIVAIVALPIGTPPNTIVTSGTDYVTEEWQKLNQGDYYAN